MAKMISRKYLPDAESLLVRDCSGSDYEISQWLLSNHHMLVKLTSQHYILLVLMISMKSRSSDITSSLIPADQSVNHSIYKLDLPKFGISRYLVVSISGRYQDINLK